MANHGMWEFAAAGESYAFYNHSLYVLVQFRLTYDASRQSYILHDVGDRLVNVAYPAAKFPPHTLLPAVESLLQSQGYTPA